jgi:ABC-2 type transport system ATP-binding protein
MDTIVKIQRLRKEFGLLTAVDDISFEVNKGEVLGFLGPNGAGKSTTMKMIQVF